MSRVITDEERDRLLQEPKSLASNWLTRLRPRSKAKLGHAQRALDIVGNDGNSFSVFVRENENRAADFSVGLQLVEKGMSAIR